jgi:hypothetical protein
MIITRALPVACIFGLIGCHVPMSPSAPLDPPTAETIDSTSFGMHVEYPAVDMLATVASAPAASAPNRYPASPSPSFSAHIATGINPSMGLQFGVEGALYGNIIPVPHGGWMGLRLLVAASDTRDIGIAIRGGYAGFLATWDQVPYDGSTVNVGYMAVTGSVRFKAWNSLQPGVALTAQPMVALPSIEGGDADNLYGLIAATTISVATRWVTPFVTGGAVLSSNARGLGPYLSFGLALVQK